MGGNFRCVGGWKAGALPLSYTRKSNLPCVDERKSVQIIGFEAMTCTDNTPFITVEIHSMPSD